MKQNIYTAITTRLFKLVVAALVLVLPLGYALAADCDLKSSPPRQIIEHDVTIIPATSLSYCELCGFGYVTVIITTPYDGAYLAISEFKEELLNSGLTFDSSAPDRMQVNGTTVGASADPNIG